MKNLAKRAGLLLVSGLVMHGAIVACSGGDSASTAYAGTGGTGAGGSGASTSSAAGTTAGSAGTGNGCGCAQPTTIDVEAAEFQALPAVAMYKTWVAVLNVPGRDVNSLLGTTAYATSDGGFDPLNAGAASPYKQVEVRFRDGNVVALCGDVGNAGAAPIYTSIRFVVPPAH